MDSFSCLNHLRSQPPWLLILCTLGLLTSLHISTTTLLWLYTTFLRPSKNLTHYGSWALITGATDGIGKSLAFQLARNNLNLILVGRNPDKLNQVSETLLANNPKSLIKTVVIDFSGDITSGLSRLREAIKGLDIGVLVNNAGVCYPYARFFHEVDEELMRDLIRVNVEGITRVTQAVIPVMLERKRGAIVNIGSGSSSVLPCDPLMAVYAATKGYIDQFSRCLYVEYKSKGIDVQCQVPLYVATKMAPMIRSSIFVPSPDTYARSTLRWIGYEPRCTPYWPHSILWCLLSMLPEWAINQGRLNFCLGIRKRGQLNDAKEKEQ